ncbi:MAG TPA: tryptophan--tRNA ligase, partial [Thermoplasmatales archaeon]|nr:tryptophan--tRNA ligase [Thermoplasmatales archaeon]
TRDGRKGIFVKVDENVEKLLGIAEDVARSIGLEKMEKIEKYKALYLIDASEEDMERIDEELVKIESELGNLSFITPSSTYHMFMTGLNGQKMSSSVPESAIFLTDPIEEARKKVMKAKTGGRVTLEEQRKYGGNPEECVVYQLFLYHLIESDKELENIYISCKNGDLICGDCKKRAAEAIENLLMDLKEKRESAKESIRDFMS